jgi:glutamate carboxypeptidase
MDLSSIDNDYSAMEALLIKLAEINSYSYNIAGLDQVREIIKSEFESFRQKFPGLQFVIEELELEDEISIDASGNEVTNKLSKSLVVRKLCANKSAKKILLMGHLDTVYPPHSMFQHCKALDVNKLNGPGVADLKGGLVVLLKALEYFEASDKANNIEWKVFLNTDEEIGSPASQKYFPELAETNDLGMIYEPSLSDGSIAYRRKGTGNYQVVIRGKAAHVGRDFASGVSAIQHAAEFISRLNKYNSDKLTINFGKIQGGGPLNVVPDLVIIGINVRIENSEDGGLIEKILEDEINLLNSTKGLLAKLYGKINRKPKIPNKELDDLFVLLESCANELGQNISRKNTGGCCDGNNLYEYGLINIDTLGVRGGNIHSEEEYICLESLTERAKLSALFLYNLAS